MTRSIRLCRTGFGERPVFDTAVSKAMLQRVASGAEPETFRLYRPARAVAFAQQDAIAPGIDDAVRVAHDHGYAATLRLAGGRAALYHEDTIAFAWTIPTHDPREGIRLRFTEIAGVVVAALRVGLNVDARVGEVPGEYCPGAFSVNARGRYKLMGVGQRLVRGAAHVGGVIVVDGSDRLREVLVPVYEALGLSMNPSSAGSVRDEGGPDITWDSVARALADELGARYELEEAMVSDDTLELAESLAADLDLARPAADLIGDRSAAP